jgi:hypothetical protein
MRRIPKNILSIKKLLEKGHTVMLNSNKRFIKVNRQGTCDTTKIDLTGGSNGMYYIRSKQASKTINFSFFDGK